MAASLDRLQAKQTNSTIYCYAAISIAFFFGAFRSLLTLAQPPPPAMPAICCCSLSALLGFSTGAWPFVIPILLVPLLLVT